MMLCVSNNGALMQFDSEQGKPVTLHSNIEMNGPALDQDEMEGLPPLMKLSRRRRPITVNFSFWRFLEFKGHHCAVYLEDDLAC